MYADPYGYIIWRNLKSMWSRCIHANDCRGCQDAEVLKDVRSLFPCNSRGSSPRYEEFGQKSNCLRTELHQVQIFQWSYSFYWKFYSPLPQNSISDNILIFGSAWHKANVFALPCCKAFVVGICLIFQNAIPNFMISASSAVKNICLCDQGLCCYTYSACIFQWSSWQWHSEFDLLTAVLHVRH